MTQKQARKDKPQVHALLAACPRAFLFARVGRGAAPHVDHAHLRDSRCWSWRQLLDHRAGFDSPGQELETLRPVLDAHRRLRAHDTDAGAHVRHVRSSCATLREGVPMEALGIPRVDGGRRSK